MELNKITESDLSGKGVVGQPEVPGLTALEMQEKVEEIVREVAIAKINEIIDYLSENGATKEDLENIVLTAGAVTSVFGRAGTVKAKQGDYTAKMVGAAEEKHAEQHFSGGSDPITAEDIGAAAEEHSHGNISHDGKIGTVNGKVLMTGIGGKIEAFEKAQSGFLVPPALKEVTADFTAEDSTEYYGDGISDFVFRCDTEKTAGCHGFITFGAPGNIELSGFDFIDDPDGIESAEAGSRWEFDLEKGCLIVRKRSE